MFCTTVSFNTAFVNSGRLSCDLLYWLGLTKIIYINSLGLSVCDCGPALAGWARERFRFLHKKFRHPVDGWCTSVLNYSGPM